MANDSTRAVYAALISNVAIALMKYVAAAMSGSSALLTEAIHSTADTVNQLLLLHGQHRAKAPPDETHQFGYGLEAYFWTFVVGFMVLLLGGGVALYEGVRHIQDPTPVMAPTLGLAVLGASALLDGASFVFELRLSREAVRGERVGGRRIGFWKFIRMSKDPGMFETLLEDAAALLGVALAAGGIIASAYFHVWWADGVASVLIGLLLVADALVIMEATRNLIAGEAVAPPLHDKISRVLHEHANGLAPHTLRSLQLGPETILLVLGLHSETTIGSPVPNSFDALKTDLMAVDDRIKEVLFSQTPAKPSGIGTQRSRRGKNN